VSTLKELFTARQNNETIGIITFNSNQRDLIMDLIDAEAKKDKVFAETAAKEYVRKHNGEDIGLFVKNIENVQGDERDIIVFSFAYAKDKNGKLIRNFGWLNQSGGENRLNVAISRAKKKIIVITSLSPEELVTDDLKNQGPKFLRKYMEYTRAVSSRNDKLAEKVLLSMSDRATVNSAQALQVNYEADVVSALKEALPKDYVIEQNVGMGTYKIDIAVKQKASGKYVMGIELDGGLYEYFDCTRERDIHRRKYFTSRGWKIYRLFSNDWWKNKDGELRSIREQILTP